MKAYNLQKSWFDNLRAAPTRSDDNLALTPIPGNWSWCGLPLDSPLGIPAGPLLDSRWLLYYADLGFDWLVYKTVRTAEHPCHPMPNLVPVDAGQISNTGHTLKARPEMQRTWAVSFGMPSQPPSVWRADVQAARDQLPSNKQLIVSVVATQDTTITDPTASLNQVAADFSLCARWAVESGANGIVANFSCPNVATSDGQLYQQPVDAGYVAQSIRDAIGRSPFALKIGLLTDPHQARNFLDCVSPWIDGLVMTNSIPAHVRDPQGKLLFEGNSRGICGDAIRVASIQQVAMFRDLIRERNNALSLIGVGGISDRNHVQSYLDAGAECVGIATAAMCDPGVALSIRDQWCE